MAGHSHWARIKRAKAANDAKRGRLWSKLARKIIVAAKSGGGDPDENLQLRYAIDEAKSANMPNDTIDKAIKKGTGELASTDYQRVIYEGYGPAGVAFMVDCLTDNRNRTVSEIRNIFTAAGGQLGTSNCVAWMFEQKGTFDISADAADEDTLMEVALDCGADDVTRDGDLFEIICQPAQFSQVTDALKERGIATVSAELAMVPQNTISVDGDQARKVIALVEALEENDDVQDVYSNCDLPDDVLAEAEAEA